MSAGRGSLACLAGVGQTDFSFDSEKSTERLAFEAIVAAVEDAGIDPSRIDGFVPFPMGPSSEDVMPLVGATDVRFTAVSHMGGASSTASLQLARLAVESGAANYVVAFVARNGRSGIRIDQRVRQLAGQTFRQELEYVHGMNTPAQWYSLICRRHIHEFGTTREALGAVALQMRANAQLNEHAQLHGRPLTWEQYLAAPVIADPYRKYDCCLETDGASAVVVTTAERARDLLGTAVTIASVAEGHPDSADDIANRRDFFDTGLIKAAPRGFAEAGLTPDDVDLALIYDCFTFEVIQQLEEAGFCARGDGGDFVTDGNIALDGRLPVNPHGGLLAEGHVAGMNHVVEAVRQLRGDCGARQVPAARVAAVTGWGDMGDGALALLTVE